MRRTIIAVLATLVVVARPRRRPPSRDRRRTAPSPAPGSSARCPPSSPTSTSTRRTLLGRHGVTAGSLHAKAMCDKHGADVADVGPGGDWICLMSWTDPNVPMPPEGYGKFELNVHSNDCYTAGGPSKLIGLPDHHRHAGPRGHQPRLRVRRLLRPRDNSPTGVEYPSLLTVTSPVVTPDSQGRAVRRSPAAPATRAAPAPSPAPPGTRSSGPLPSTSTRSPPPRSRSLPRSPGAPPRSPSPCT